MECKPELITSDPAACIPQSDIIIIAGVPIHHNPALLRQMKPHLPVGRKVFIGTICAYGGFDWVAHRELQHCCDYSLFGAFFFIASHSFRDGCVRCFGDC